MLAKARKYLVAIFAAGVFCVGVSNTASAASGDIEVGDRASSWAERGCLRDGWEKLTFDAAGHRRSLLYKGPGGAWRNGVIIVLHGGGGDAANFCRGRRLVRPQIHFTEMALARGFAVIVLESTDDIVTDAQGRVCGKRFDFSVLDRPNIDLPYIGRVLDDVIPSKRPAGSSQSVFITGLSTGGYMTTRAATYFSSKITAFAPVSAGDPYGTDTICDTSLSKRKSAKGILVDADTKKEITQNEACQTSDFSKEANWPKAGSSKMPPFKQFQDASDGIVDLSCMKRAEKMLDKQGYPDRGAFIIPYAGKKDVFKHLWQDEYNEPILDFFESEVSKAQ